MARPARSRNRSGVEASTGRLQPRKPQRVPRVQASSTGLRAPPAPPPRRCLSRLRRGALPARARHPGEKQRRYMRTGEQPSERDPAAHPTSSARSPTGLHTLLKPTGAMRSLACLSEGRNCSGVRHAEKRKRHNKGRWA
ncbi:hypothetical protein NDU88_004472 [Pleurodeles waltl]|uniref:Uncharacterized protein n=1 Tax=Pleurodeles waltl TaxID=8319 RepID=A0AAV7LLG3_PLEWA|nr:hypothetical protein NDU88_004472 [Pleurodeles waltl]